eukprot:gene3824-2706_t
MKRRKRQFSSSKQTNRNNNCKGAKNVVVLVSLSLFFLFVFFSELIALLLLCEYFLLTFFFIGRVPFLTKKKTETVIYSEDDKESEEDDRSAILKELVFFFPWIDSLRDQTMTVISCLDKTTVWDRPGTFYLLHEWLISGCCISLQLQVRDRLCPGICIYVCCDEGKEEHIISQKQVRACSTSAHPHTYVNHAHCLGQMNQNAIHMLLGDRGRWSSILCFYAFFFVFGGYHLLKRPNFGYRTDIQVLRHVVNDSNNSNTLDVDSPFPYVGVASIVPVIDSGTSEAQMLFLLIISLKQNKKQKPKGTGSYSTSTHLRK